jgi:hypothetical protein
MCEEILQKTEQPAPSLKVSGSLVEFAGEVCLSDFYYGLLLLGLGELQISKL